MAQPTRSSSIPRRPLEGSDRGGADIGSLDANLDAVLQEHLDRKTKESAKNAPQAPPLSPTEQFRQRFAQQLVPVAEGLKKRLTARQIELVLDASDFLGGGSRLLIEARFEGRGLGLEGTVLSDVIAFQETRFRCDGGDSTCRMSAGPMLRTSTLSAEAFAKFLYEWVIKLVRSVDRA